MTRLPVVSGREAIKAFARTGFRLDHQTGTHMILRQDRPPFRRLTVPDHKALAKAPKIHRIDSGLVCHPLGTRDTRQLRHHPARDAIFESWAAAAETCEARAHRGVAPDL